MCGGVSSWIPAPKKRKPEDEEEQPMKRGGCENEPAEQSIAGPRPLRFKGIDH